MRCEEGSAALVLRVARDSETEASDSREANGLPAELPGAIDVVDTGAAAAFRSCNAPVSFVRAHLLCFVAATQASKRQIDTGAGRLVDSARRPDQYRPDSASCHRSLQ